MLGWMIVFAIFALFSGGNLVSAGDFAPLSMKLMSALFGALFLISVAIRTVRGRA